MKVTNDYNLPQSLVRAIAYDDYDHKNAGDISATSLISPPRIRQLTHRHWNEISEDVSERIWRLIGSIGHKIIERAGDPNEFSEERLSTTIHGWTVTGKIDLIRESGGYVIEDFKLTSVWTLKELKPEYEQQLNIYALLARHNGFNVTQLRIIAVLRDWSKPRAAREPDYPQVGVVVREVPLWSVEEQEAYLGERVRQHQRAATILLDADLPLCTEEERWRKPDVWAVKKKGNKRALRVWNNETDAIAMKEAGILTGIPLEIEFRPGVDVRCVSYCPVAKFCSYGKTLASTEDVA